MAKTRNQKIKGVILAGGMGTRLRPLTLITNKHLLPVYDKPMILYPLYTLRDAGITDIIIITGREHAGHFMKFLGSGSAWGVTLSYAIQDTDNGGIADALRCASDFAREHMIAVILGDNIFMDNFSDAVKKFTGGAKIFIKKVPDPERYGVPVFNKEGRITKVEEKPKKPKSEFAQTGFYLFDTDAIDRVGSLKPSARGELEITDLVNLYIDQHALTHATVQKHWFDAGTFDSLAEAANCIRVERTEKKYE